MDLSFEELNSRMEELLNQYRTALNNGEYDKVKGITASVLQLYRDTYKVRLDERPEFDHIFHQVMQKMQSQLRDSRPTTQEAAEKEVEIINMFSEVADGVFKVFDVRRQAMELQPSAEDLIAAYEEGIADANDQIARLEKLQQQYEAVSNVVFGKETPNLKDKISDKKFNIGTLELINSQITKMDELQNAIDTMEAEIVADPTKEALYRGKINANQSELTNLLSDVTLKVDAMKAKGLNVDSIKDAMDSNNAKRLATQANVTALRDSLDASLTSDYTELMNNIINAKKRFSHIDQIANIDLTDIDPSKKEGRAKLDLLIAPFMELFGRVENGLKLQKNRIKVYEQSIHDVREEQKIMEIDTNDRSRYEDGMTDDVRDQIEAEKEYYRQDMLDKLYGNPEKAKLWKEYYGLFSDAKKSVPFTFTDESGNTQNGTYMTIDYEKFSSNLAGLTPPVSLKDALKLLQLEEYKERLERLSKYQAGDKSVKKELPSYEKYLLAKRAFDEATTPEKKENARNRMNLAENEMEKELRQDQLYIATNHGATDNNELIAKAIADAGTLVKYKRGRLAYKDQDTLGGKIKAFGHNYASLIGLRTVGDAKTLLGKAGTVVLDTGLIAISPFSAATKVIYRYFPVVGKEAQSKRFIKKHAGENSSPYEGRADARKMKRRKEYKAEMKGIFKGARAWIKATNDNFLFKDRAKETEEAFCKRELEERVYPSIENRYILGAQVADKTKQEKAKHNLRKRQADVRTVAGRSYGYNDLIADPTSAESHEFEKQSILGAALEEHGEDAEALSYSTTSRPRDRRFVKDNTPLDGSLYKDLDSQVDFSDPKGSVVQSDALDRATRQEGITATYTARNYVPYTITGVATAMAGRYAFSKIQTIVERTIPGTTDTQTVWEKHFKGYETYNDQVRTPHITQQVDTSTVARTPADFASANNSQSVHLHKSVWGGERGGYDVDLSGYDSTVGFYAEVPKDAGGIERIALAIPQDGGKYDYLGQLVTRYGLDQATVEKYIDVATGTFKSDADLYQLVADISNHTGATTGLTGDKLVEMVFTNPDAKAYVSSALSPGSYNGGWFDVTDLGQTLGTRDVVTYTIDTVPKTRPVFEWEEVSTPITNPDTIERVVDPTRDAIRTAGMLGTDALAIGHVVESTDKAIGAGFPETDKSRAASKRARRQDRPDEVEPARHMKGKSGRGEGDER